MNGDVPAWKSGRFGGLNSSCCLPVPPGSVPSRYCEILNGANAGASPGSACAPRTSIGVPAPDVVLTVQDWSFVDELAEQLRAIFAEVVVDEVELALGERQRRHDLVAGVLLVVDGLCRRPGRAVRRRRRHDARVANHGVGTKLGVAARRPGQIDAACRVNRDRRIRVGSEGGRRGGLIDRAERGDHFRRRHGRAAVGRAHGDDRVRHDAVVELPPGDLDGAGQRVDGDRCAL